MRETENASIMLADGCRLAARIGCPRMQRKEGQFARRHFPFPAAYS